MAELKNKAVNLEVLKEVYKDLDTKKANKTDISTPYKFRGNCTFASLPTSGNEVNDAFYVTDKKCKYSWNGTNWYQSSLDETDYLDEFSNFKSEVNNNVDELKGDLSDVEEVSFDIDKTAMMTEIDIDSLGIKWYSQAGCFYGNDGWRDAMVSDTFKGCRVMDTGCIVLKKGDMLLTNTDTYYTGQNFGANHGILMTKKISGDNYWKDTKNTILFYGRGKFDGKYIRYTATDEYEYITVNYETDVDYDIHFYVVSKNEITMKEIPFSYRTGYLESNTGKVISVSETESFVTGYNGEVITNQIDISAPGKFMLVTNTKFRKDRSGYRWVKYSDDGTMNYGMLYDRWKNDFMIIPLFEDTEHIRFTFNVYLYPVAEVHAYLVDAEYLIQNGYCDKLAGKSISVFGDSYVAGHSIGAWRTWHYMFAEQHQMQYFNHGFNGYGLVLSPNTNDNLMNHVSEIEDSDYIICIFGRNDYSRQVPIGTDDDTQESGTFKGVLNYMCEYLIDNHLDSKLLFITPWNFPSTATNETIKPIEYIDAMLEITGKHGIPCFDAARRSNIHVKSQAFRTKYFLSASDISHLNVDGAKLMMGTMDIPIKSL